MNKVVDAAAAVASIRDGQAVASVGVIGWITPDAILKALGDRFRRTGAPRDLTFYFPVGTGDAQDIKGMDHVAQVGLMKRIVSGSYINPVDPRTGKRPELMRLIRENAIEAYSWPIGASMHWLREVARKSPGYLTRVGLGSYVDPAQGGGKFTAKATKDLVRRIEIDGETLLYYPTWPIDVAIVRASSADEYGNLSFEDEPLTSSNTGLVLAAKASGGRVIAQVRHLVASDSRPASAVPIPGMFVDAVVVDEAMMMASETPYEPAYFGGNRMRLSQLPRPEMSAHKVIAARAAQEVRKRELSIFGFGAAADVPLVMSEQGIFDQGALKDYWFTTEHGSYGGVVMSGWQFSANVNPDSIMDGLYQFDAIDGGLCQFAALAFAQFDAQGAVNVSKFGTANPGAGGFLDIAENARRLVFTGTFTANGLNASFESDRLNIKEEGRVKKFCRAADAVTYSVAQGVRERGQTALVVTERAVFEYRPNGLTLSELAPGVDLDRDVLAQMEFTPIVDRAAVREMDRKLFAKGAQSNRVRAVS